MVYLILLFFFIYIYFLYLHNYNYEIDTKSKISTIILNIDIHKIPDKIKNNETELYNYICNNINLNDLKIQIENIVKNYNLIISNKTIYNRSLEIPNGEIFRYMFNHETCKMLLYEGIFCEINFENIKIPLHINLSS